MSEGVNELLVNWLRRVKKAQIAYTRSATYFEKRHYWLGSTIILLSTFAGTSLWATNLNIKIVSSIASIISAILAGFQTFFRLAERAEKFRLVGAKYGKLRLDLEHKINFLHEGEELEQYAESVLQEWNRIQNEAPPAPQWMWDKIQLPKNNM